MHLMQVSEPMRLKVATLLRDVMTHYPYTVQGCPVMLYAEPETEYQRALSFELPAPSEAYLEPCEGLRFLRWTTVDGPIPLLDAEPIELAPTPRAPLLRMVCKVALFECSLDDHEAQSLEIPSMWWARVLSPVDAQLHVSARALMPYPDAIEAGRCAQSAAQGRNVPKRGFFQSDTSWSWAWNEGVLFRESCRNVFPHANFS
ncbi:hypothetical protein ACOTHJ_15615 [Achromobacter xylosoxidans]